MSTHILKIAAVIHDWSVIMLKAIIRPGDIGVCED
jgi:hypothetical protein